MLDNTTIDISLQRPVVSEIQAHKSKTVKRVLVTNQSMYNDLINNYEEFHKIYPEERLLELSDDIVDHAPVGYYNHLPTVEDHLNNCPEENMHKGINCRVFISKIFSSEKSKVDGAYDRPIWTMTKGDPKWRMFLNQELADGSKKGWAPGDAEALSCYFRFLFEKDGVEYWILVKYKGNGRVHGKLIASKGVDTEVEVRVTFHPKEYTEEQCRVREADGHTTDAVNGNSQGEEERFFSAHAARRPWAIYCYNFLKRNNLDYANIMVRDGVRTTKNHNDFLTITHLQGLKDGEGNGYFKKFGEHNVVLAMKSIHEIAKETTKENVMNSITLACFSHMFNIFTKYGYTHNAKPFFTVEQMNNFFIKFYKLKNTMVDTDFGKGNELKLSELSVSGGVKDISFICATTFWPELVEYYKYGIGHKKGFKADSFACEKFMKSTDKLLKDRVYSILNKG